MQFAALKALDVSYKFLGAHPEIVSQSHSDEILADAFRLQMEGKTAACKQTVNQALLLQYCALLGKDGVMMFFKR